MLPYYRSLQLTAIFEIFVVSISGFYLPIFLVQQSSYSAEQVLQTDTFKIGRSFSTGIIIGLAVMHLLVDAAEVQLLRNGYPLIFAIVLLGILSLIAFEQIAIIAMTSVNTISSSSSVISSSSQLKLASHLHINHHHKDDIEVNNDHHDHHINDHDHGHEHHHIHEEENKHQHDDISCQCDDHHDHHHQNHNIMMASSLSIDDHAHTHAHATHLVLDKDINKALMKAIIMECSIAIHSIVIGFAVGSYTSSDVSTIQALMIAYAFHQFFEGMSLGVTISLAKFHHTSSFALALFFALTVPVGIIIGMTTTASHEGNVASEVANAFAAGSLLYNGLIEMAAEDFADPVLTKRPALKMYMIISMFLGAFCMALIANWA